jgi:hypothetical protein
VHLNGGELLTGADVVIIDESALDSLLAAQLATPAEVRCLHDAVASKDANDPALPLLAALTRVAKQHTTKGAPLRGAAFLEALECASGVPLTDLIEAARTSKWIGIKGLSRENLSLKERLERLKQLPKLFLASLLRVLERDSEHRHNAQLTYAYIDGAWRWRWYERRTLLAALHDTPTAPAVIVLDGSAYETISARLFHPWSVDVRRIDVPISPAVRIVQYATAASTRRLVKEPERLKWTARALAAVCNQLGCTLDGGISYKAAAPDLKELLGGEWLHYGGQRGSNELEHAHTLAIVASPTQRPDVIFQKTLALFGDSAADITDTAKRVGTGTFEYTNENVRGVYELLCFEELRQSIHRARPVRATEPTTLVIFSPWPLEAIGLTPHLTIEQLPYGNSKDAREALQRYNKRRTVRQTFNILVAPIGAPTAVQSAPAAVDSATAIPIAAASIPVRAAFNQGDGSRAVVAVLQPLSAPSPSPWGTFAPDDSWVQHQLWLKACGKFHADVSHLLAHAEVQHGKL